MSNQSDLADLIRNKFVGVEPDSQDAVLEDSDWHLILTALTDHATATRQIAERDARVAELVALSDPANWKDRDDEWTEAITAAHPMRSTDPDRHKTFAVAMEMVGNRHGKYALVGLVQWLLTRALAAEADAKDLRERLETARITRVEHNRQHHEERTARIDAEADAARVREALEPFAAAYECVKGTENDQSTIYKSACAMAITFGDIRAAHQTHPMPEGGE